MQHEHRQILTKRSREGSQRRLHPPLDSLKFNVDGAGRGKPGPAEIGGTLRNANGEILVTFLGVKELMRPNF